MAPPHKRRRTSYSSSQASATVTEPVATIEATPAFSHGVEHLQHSHTSSRLRQVPQHIEELHLEIHQQAISALDTHPHLHRRQQQGTAVSSESTSLVASTDSAGSTTAVSTTTDSASGVSSSATSTDTVDSSSVTESSSALSSSASSSNASSETTSSDTSSTASLAGTGVLSTSSSVASTASGFIGNSATSGTAPSSTASATSGNSSIVASASSASLSATLSSIGSASNLTTSAIIIKGSSTTVTSRTTIDLATTTSGSDSRSAQSSSQTSSIDGALVFLATLQGGEVETITRSTRAYATTFSDGQVSTIAPVSGSAVVTTLSNGVTSTYYTTAPAASGSDAVQSTVISTQMIGGAGQAGSTVTSSATSSTSSAASHHNDNSNNSTPPAGTIAGGVVGGAAGLAVVLLIAMLFLRWYRRKSQLGHQALPPNSGLSPDPDQASVSRGPGMAERAGLMPIMGAVPALFRHHDRSQEQQSEPSERGFTRVSGRKLPSSFSPGMNSPPPTMPMTGPEQNLSSTSFYRDSAGFYGGEGGGGPGSPTNAAHASDATPEEMTLSPGPQRRPTVHAGGPYVMSPTGSSPSSPLNPGNNTLSPPGTGTTATFDRSDTPSSLDPNRSSRFTEEV